MCRQKDIVVVRREDPAPRTATDSGRTGSFLFILVAAAAVLSAITVVQQLYRNAADHGAEIQETLCNVTNAEALSAIERAESSFCKHELTRFACRLQANSVYPDRLPSFCPNAKPDIAVNLIAARPVRILFVLTVHGRDSRQVRRLLQLLFRDEHHYLIHVDRRSDFLFDELLPLETILPNLKLMRTRHSPIWGGASLLTVLLDAIYAGLALPDWDFFVNLSESDLPLRSVDELVAYLNRNYGSNFFKAHGRQYIDSFIRVQGLNTSFFECDNHMWKTGPKKLPTGIAFDGGSDWFVLHRDFCQYLQERSTGRLLSGLRVVYNYTLLPAESFFHTAIHNSPFCHTFVNNNLRYSNWQRHKGCHCNYKHIVDWCGCSPSVILVEDLKRFEVFDNQSIFFARKFDPVVDLLAIDMILAGLRSREPDKADFPLPPRWDRHWSNLYSHTEAYPVEGMGALLNSLRRISSNLVQTAARENSRQMTSDQTPSSSLISSYLTVDLSGKKHLLVEQEVALADGRRVVIESLVDIKDHYYFYDETVPKRSPARRLKRILVSTKYDQKDGVFRNYANAMDTYSDPVLSCTTWPGEQFNVTFVWTDPHNSLASNYSHNITSDAQISTIQPEFAKPLVVGIWTVSAFHKTDLIATTKFLILPCFVSPTPADRKVPNEASNHDTDSTDTVSENSENDENEKIITEWTDTAIEFFYAVEDICAVDVESKKLLHHTLDLCVDTFWSSYFPDDSLIF